MSIFLAATQLFLISCNCFLELKRRSCAIFLWATLLLMFGIMHLHAVLVGNSEYAVSIYNEASIFVIFFCLLYMCTRLLLHQPYEKEYKSFFNSDQLFLNASATYSAFLILYLAATVLMAWHLIYFAGGVLETSWGVARGYSASLDYFSGNQFLGVIYNAFSGLAVYYWYCRKKNLSMLCLAAVLFLAIVTRNRVLVIPFLLFFIEINLFKIKRIKFKYVIYGMFAAIVVIYIVYGLRVFRHYGSIAVFLNNFDLFEFIDRINLYIVTDNGELGLRKVFYYFLQNDNEFADFGTGASYIRMLLIYIPTRVSFGLKPNDFAQSMGAAIGMGVGGSTHPTLFGDCYANLGWWGIGLGIFWALFATCFDYVIMKFKEPIYRILLYTNIALSYVIIGRGSVYNGFFYMAWSIPLLYVLSRLINHIPALRVGSLNK